MTGFFDFNNNGKTDLFDSFVTGEAMQEDHDDADSWDDDHADDEDNDDSYEEDEDNDNDDDDDLM